MKINVTRQDLAAAEPFGIARGTKTEQSVLTVELSHEGKTGIGGAALSAYYGETPDSVARDLSSFEPFLRGCDDPHAGQRVARRLAERAPDAPAARAAVSTALADLAARDLGIPCYRQWGLDPDATPRTSYTVGIAAPDEMGKKASRAVAEGYDILKVKVGTDDDQERIRAVRDAAPDANLRVDANCAWDSETAIEQAQWLSEVGVSFLEQPVPADDIAGLRRVHEEAPLPVCADESCVVASDVPAVASACDIVTVKLMKCGGVRPALEQINAAHAHGIDVMLGCMLESNASIAPACHLAPLVEYADLDGALLLSEDPYDGVPMPGGRIDIRAVESGTGVDHVA